MSGSLTILGPLTPYVSADPEVPPTEGPIAQDGPEGAAADAPAEKKFYAVICAREVGVFEGWYVWCEIGSVPISSFPRENVQPLVKRLDQPTIDLAGVRTPSFRTREKAETCFREALVAGIVQKLED